MSDYRIESASREEWAERALRAEAERDRLIFVAAKLLAQAITELAPPKTSPGSDE